MDALPDNVSVQVRCLLPRFEQAPDLIAGLYSAAIDPTAYQRSGVRAAASDSRRWRLGPHSIIATREQRRALSSLTCCDSGR
jgi:hypothetical protein